MLPPATPQAKLPPQPLNAAPMKIPSQKLCMKSPMITAPITRALLALPATVSFASAPPSAPASATCAGARLAPSSAPASAGCAGARPPMAVIAAMNALSKTAGSRKPASTIAPQRQSTSTSSFQPSAMRCVDSKSRRKNAHASSAPAAKAARRPSTISALALANVEMPGTARTTPISVTKLTRIAAPMDPPQSASRSAAACASGSSASGSTSAPLESFR
mmetsp:Transcript_106815/g.335019  ORF Transcript_106815/g.335019 Transcript_106815/m.335019 type:complete len:219 (-) Transcript_106815:516-1172(-)